MLTGSCESALTLCFLVPSFMWIRCSKRSCALQSSCMRPYKKSEIQLLFKLMRTQSILSLSLSLSLSEDKNDSFFTSTSEALRLKRFSFLLRQVLILEFVLIWIQLKITRFICLYSSDEEIRGTRYDWCAYTCLIEVMGCVQERLLLPSLLSLVTVVAPGSLQTCCRQLSQIHRTTGRAALATVTIFVLFRIFLGWKSNRYL